MKPLPGARCIPQYGPDFRNRTRVIIHEDDPPLLSSRRKTYLATTDYAILAFNM